jgi:hypothetical protein
MSMRIASIVLVCSIAGCGGGRSRGAEEAPELLTLSEARALEIITGLLDEESVPIGAPWTISLSHETQLEVDVRLGGSMFGIEWMSPQDREDMGDQVPGPTGDDRLRIVPGYGTDEGAQVLVLEHSSFEYANEREAVQRGTAGAHDVENRLRGVLRDYLDYARGQGPIE